MVVNLAFNSHFSNPCSFRNMTLMIFSKKFSENLDLKNSTTLKISILFLDFVRVISGVANLAFDYGCSNLCSFRDMTFF